MSTPDEEDLDPTQACIARVLLAMDLDEAVYVRTLAIVIGLMACRNPNPHQMLFDVMNEAIAIVRERRGDGS